MTIYIGIPVNRMEEAKVLVNMFWSQLISANTDELPSKNPDLKYKVTLLMDEFIMMGRLGVLAKGAAFIAGYNIRLISIVQSPQQLYAKAPEGYGENTARGFISNHSLKMIFTPDEQADADAISKMLGTYTYKARSTTLGKSKPVNYSLEKAGSESDQSRALMLPQELREMSFDDQIVMLKGHKPIKCKKIKYYSDPVYMEMIKSVSPSLGVIDGIPSEEEFKRAWSNNELMIDIPAIDFDLLKAKKYNLTKLASIEEIEQAKGEDIPIETADLLNGLEGNLTEELTDDIIEELSNRLIEANGSYTENELATTNHFNNTEPSVDEQSDVAYSAIMNSEATDATEVMY